MCFCANVCRFLCVIRRKLTEEKKKSVYSCFRKVHKFSLICDVFREDITWLLGDTASKFDCWRYLSRVSGVNDFEPILSAREDKIRIPTRHRHVLYMLSYGYGWDIKIKWNKTLQAFISFESAENTGHLNWGRYRNRRSVFKSRNLFLHTCKVRSRREPHYRDNLKVFLFQILLKTSYLLIIWNKASIINIILLS